MLVEVVLNLHIRLFYYDIFIILFFEDSLDPRPPPKNGPDQLWPTMTVNFTEPVTLEPFSCSVTGIVSCLVN